jgi:hypothetical protein
VLSLRNSGKIVGTGPWSIKQLAYWCPLQVPLSLRQFIQAHCPPTRWKVISNLSEVLAVHAALLPNGKVLYFSGSEHDELADRTSTLHATRLWNPATEKVEQVGGTPSGDLFCCGHCLLPNGNVLVAGGTAEYDKTAPDPHGAVHHFTGIELAHIFDWRKNSWRSTGSMRDGRWYPTCVTLPDGRVLAMSGHSAGGPQHENTTLDFYNPSSEAWTNVSATPSLIETVPSLFRIPIVVFGIIVGYIEVMPMVYYPRLHVLPTGEVFSSTALRVAGSENRMTRMLNPTTLTVTEVAEPPGSPALGAVVLMAMVYSRSAFASVLLPLKPPAYEARILICGQKQPLLFEPGRSDLGWQAGSERPYAMRAYANAVLTPDGKVLLVGGATSERGPFSLGPAPPIGSEIGGYDRDAIPYPEQYDPDTNTWQTLDSPPYPEPEGPIARVYHSVALLLPDGRVWIAGSNHDSDRNKGGVRRDDPNKGDARELRMEVYSPPYLFSGTDDNGNPIPALRPRVERVDPFAFYGQQFTIYTPDAPDIAAVALIRCSTVTHAFNPDQRYVGLAIDQRTSTSLGVSAPPTPEIAPPGYYMLFVLNYEGTPSHAKFLRLQPTLRQFLRSGGFDPNGGIRGPMRDASVSSVRAFMRI